MNSFPSRFFLCFLLVHAGGAAGDAVELSFSVADEGGASLPCRIHVSDAEGKALHPPNAPVWRGGFVCGGNAKLELPPGRYQYEIEKGPEWSASHGTTDLEGNAVTVKVKLNRIADLKQEGWFSGDLHVHRAPGELPLHLLAEDLSVASVQTWWNKRNQWGRHTPPNPVKESGGRFYHILGGEDERGGGALLYHRMEQVVDITAAEREWPASVSFLDAAKAAGAWVEVEKPFWWDTPLWLATGKIDSVGLAHNHMNRTEVYIGEAWGRPRDTDRYPGTHGNGLYTQDLYYKILNTGLRIPPSAGSASGVLPNPVGYNRVYVFTGAEFSWEAWWEGLRKGRCFVTNGPLLRLTANGAHSGEVLRSDAALTVKIEGRIDSRDPIRKVELVQDGAAREISLPTEITMEKSGWLLARAIADVDETFRFGSTAPWYVEIGGEPMPPRRAAAAFFLKWARQRKAMIEQALADGRQRAEVAAAHDKAIDFWKKRVAAAPDP